MADTIFGKIQEEKDLYKLSNGENPSYIWFNEKVKELISISESPSELLTKWERRANKVQLYRFNMFFYDAKTKKTLPYFDMFPLVFPLRRLGNSFTGINAHYLPPSFKEDFFNIYNKFALNDEFDETTLYRMTWSKISRFKIMRPLIRQYSLSNIKSRFLVLNADEVPTALALPLARLVKPNIRFNRNVIQNVRILRQVYINSRKHIRFGKNFKGIR
tara:strand:- start:680 stop:1330 length:651 start_codon:yes stop_codon:yes gene_type:complete